MHECERYTNHCYVPPLSTALKIVQYPFIMKIHAVGRGAMFSLQNRVIKHIKDIYVYVRMYIYI